MDDDEFPEVLKAYAASSCYSGSGTPLIDKTFDQGFTGKQPYNSLLSLNPHEFSTGTKVTMTEHPIYKVKETNMSDRRIVKVFVVDPDERVPVAQALLFEGEQHLTDLTDQELFFELNVKELLATHNRHRGTIKNVDGDEDDTKFLEPVRIRDLKMIVVTVAKV